MDFKTIEKQLRTIFKKEKIVFGGSAVTGTAHQYSDIDVYIIISDILKFQKISKERNKVADLKKSINQNLHIHIMPKILLDLGFYRVEGIYFKKDQEKKFLKEGDSEIIHLNSLKLCLKHLIKYKLCQEQAEAEKHFFSLQKNFFFLTGKEEDDFEEIENKLETEIKNTPNMIWFDWLFYCMRFRRILPRHFEKNIIDCLVSLKRYINSNSPDYVEEFYNNCKQIEKNYVKTDDPEKMFAILDKYVFLIFVI